MNNRSKSKLKGKVEEVKQKRAITFEGGGKEVGDYQDMLLNDLLGAPYCPAEGPAPVGNRDENPVVYFQIRAMGGRVIKTSEGDELSKPQDLGLLHFELRRDLCPVSCANFLGLVQGYLGVGKDGVNYHYKGIKIHRILKNVMFQSGDIMDTEGECSKSVYNNGSLFRDENFIFRHTGAGCLSYCNRGADSNGSLFQVIFCENPGLDEKYVCFGCLASKESFVTLNNINSFGTVSGQPKEDVCIVDCGVSYPPALMRERRKVDLSGGGGDDDDAAGRESCVVVGNE